MLDYGIVGNCLTGALVKKNASVDWMCFPGFASPSVFARILDEKKGGSFEVKPVGSYRVRQRYLPNTAILETTFENSRHAFQVLDFFPRYRKLLPKKVEKLVKGNSLVRILRPLRGKPRVKVLYRPRPLYAMERCAFREEDGNLLCGSPHEIGLISNVSYKSLRKGKEISLDYTRYFVVGKKPTPQRSQSSGAMGS